MCMNKFMQFNSTVVRNSVKYNESMFSHPVIHVHEIWFQIVSGTPELYGIIILHFIPDVEPAC